MTELPAPLTPPDCDLRGMPFMPLDTARLLDSDLFALSSGDEFKCALALWCKSWHQVPAGSLPDDDRILAHLSGARDKWCDMSRDMVLHGWIKCDDGRLYHPVVCEKALEALPQRREYKSRKTADAERKERERQDRRALFDGLKDIGIVVEYSTKTADLRKLAEQHNVTIGHSDMSRDGHGHVTAKRGKEKEKNSSSAGACDLDLVDLLHRVASVAHLGVPDPSTNYGRHSDMIGLLKSWTDAGADPALILEVVEKRTASARKPPKSLEWFDGAIRDAVAAHTSQQSTLDRDTDALVNSILGAR